MSTRHPTPTPSLSVQAHNIAHLRRQSHRTPTFSARGRYRQGIATARTPCHHRGEYANAAPILHALSAPLAAARLVHSLAPHHASTDPGRNLERLPLRRTRRHTAGFSCHRSNRALPGVVRTCVRPPGRLLDVGSRYRSRRALPAGRSQAPPRHPLPACRSVRLLSHAT